MKRAIYLLIILFMFLFITGCFESEVPLSGPSSKVDKNLINYWESIPTKDNSKKILLAVFKFSESEYLFNWAEEGIDETIIARGFTTEIKKIKIINVQNIKTLDIKEKTYHFFKYAFNKDGILIVSILSENSPLLKNRTFKSSETFLSFIKANIESKGLFDNTIEFRPAGKLNINISS